MKLRIKRTIKKNKIWKNLESNTIDIERSDTLKETINNNNHNNSYKIQYK